MQIFTEEQAEKLQFRRARRHQAHSGRTCAGAPSGKMVLNRNPDNFFAETEQVAFCTAHVVPGIDFSNDPLLAGRILSYVDTQIYPARRTELPRDSRSIARSRRCTTTSATACIGRRLLAVEWPTSPTRSAAAVRFRRAPPDYVVPRAARARQGTRQAREIRRALQPSDSLLEQPDDVEKQHIIRGFDSS